MDSMLRVRKDRVIFACQSQIRMCTDEKLKRKYQELMRFAHHADETMCLGYADFCLIEHYLR